MTNGAHQRFHEIALEAKMRIAQGIEQAAPDASRAENCSCIRDMAEAFAILPLPHQHDGGPPHNHPAPPTGDPPMGQPHGHVMPLPPELQERLDDLLEQAGSEISPEALQDRLQDLQRAVSRAVLALVRAVRDAADDAGRAPNCACLLPMTEAIRLLLRAQMAGGMMPHTHGDTPPAPPGPAPAPPGPAPGHTH